MEKLIDIKALEDLTAIKAATLRKYVARREIPFVKVGRLVRFRLSEIESWIVTRSTPAREADGGGKKTGGTEGQLFF